MLQLDIIDEANNEAKIDLYKSMKALYGELLVPDNRTMNWEPNAAATKVHIVFGDSIAGSLKLAIKQMGYADANKVICFRDQYSIGPLWQLHEKGGRAYRGEWFRDHINKGDEDAEYGEETYHQRLTEQIATIPAEASIVIWSGNNAHEQVGLRYAVYLLREIQIQNELFVFNVEEACERRFNTADRSIVYLHAGEIPPEKLRSVFGETEESGPITCETRQLLEQEWLSLAKQYHVLRIWDGERILNVEEQHFDSYLLETVEKLHTCRSNNDFIKAARVIGEALGYCDQYIGDSYFEYRLRQLVYNGSLEIKGVPRAMRYYSVRRKCLKSIFSKI
ncbi:DUF1835 domain-containing protein [Paenibacillus sp. SI92]